MRLATCALSAVLLSGCSWLGAGGGHGDVYGYNNYGYGSQGQAQHQSTGYYDGGCAATQYAQTAVIAAAPGCAAGQGYSVAASGQYAGAGQYAGGAHYGGAGQYTGSAQINGTAYQAGSGGYATMGQGAGMAYGAGATTLSTQAPYGAAVGGQMGGGYVQTVQGGPVYMAGPAGSYSGGNMGLRGPMGGGVCCGGGASMPFGLELGIGTEFGVKGDISPDVVSKPFLGGPGAVSDLPAVSYNDAFKQGVHYDLAATYDLDRNTTLIGQVGYSHSKGQRVKLGTVDDGAGTTEDLYGEFSELEQYRVEGGLRKYVGGGHYSNMRPYVGATAGAIKTNNVTLTQSSATLVDPTLFVQNYVDGGWKPTASGVVGAEWAVGNRSAIGVETGIRWSDGLKTNLESTDRWSIPLKLRGRVSF